MADTECLCWVGHGDCGGCSGYPGIAHEPACGWEWNPDCPVHGEPKLQPSPCPHLYSDEGHMMPHYCLNDPKNRKGDGERLVANAPKRTVRKVDGLWKVTNHPDGVVSWATYHDALRYATGRLTLSDLMSDADVDTITKDILNLGLYGESTRTVTPLADGCNQITVHDHQVGP